MQKETDFVSQAIAFMRAHLKAFFHIPSGWLRFLPGLLALLCLQRAAAINPPGVDLHLPMPGDHALHILSPYLLQLVLFNTNHTDPDPADSLYLLTCQ